MRLVLALFVLAACGSKREDNDRPIGDRVVDRMPNPGSAMAEPDAYVVPKLAWPEDVAPPPPFADLRPRMKQTDALAILGAANVRRATPSDEYHFQEGDDIFDSGQLGIFVALRYTDGRLSSIVFQADDERSLSKVIEVWGGPSSIDPKSVLGVESTWRTRPSGWSAVLHTRPTPDQRAFSIWKIAELSLETSDSSFGATVTADMKFFATVGGLIGMPLATAEKAFGPGLRREIADTDESAPERGEARQGFATFSAPWSTEPWELVLRPEPSEDRIRRIILKGGTDDDSHRSTLFQAMRDAWGKPGATVTDLGRFAIHFHLVKTVWARVDEVAENRWVITIENQQ
jgi:hypothetical protein